MKIFIYIYEAILILFLALFYSSVNLKTNQVQAQDIKNEHKCNIPKDILIVKLANGVSGVDESNNSEIPFDSIPDANRPEALKEVHSDYGISSIETIFPNPQDESLKHVYKIKLKKDADSLEVALDKIKKHADVIYAQLDIAYKLTIFVPNDTYWPTYGTWGQNYADLWALKSNRMNMQPVWDPAGLNAKGSGKIVAVIDSGLDTTHPDIQGNYVPGWNFIDNNSNITDTYGHGTAVSGVIAAVGNNSKGIIGVAYGAKIMPIKVFGPSEYAAASRLASAIQYAVDHGADVINMSWGCDELTCPQIPVLEDAVRYANQNNVITVIAAGNDSMPVEYFSPDNLKSTNKNLTVSASNPNNDGVAGFSHYGTGIDVAAPGVGILTLKSQYNSLPSGITVGTNYIAVDGTSLAAPYVSGLLAVIKAKRPTLTAFELVAALKDGADDIVDPGIDIRSGTGRIDGYNSINQTSLIIAKITKPYAWDFDQLSNNILTISGTAKGDTFDHYVLQYSTRSTYLSGFTTFYSSTTSVQNGVLGTWNMASLPVDDYFIRLKVHSTDGKNYYDLGEFTYEKPNLNTIPTGVGFRARPQISGNYIVWEDSRQFPGQSVGFPDNICLDNDPTDECDIYLYDLSNSSSVAISTAVNKQRHPAISGTIIVWEDGRNGTNYNIWGCTYNSISKTCGSLRQYSNETINSINPTISGNLIVWERVQSETSYDIRTSRIRVFDSSLNTTFDLPLPQGVVSQITPRLSGSRLIWAERNSSGQYSLYSCAVNVSGQQCTRQLIDSLIAPIDGKRFPYEEQYPVIDGNKIAWLDSTGSINYCTVDGGGNCPNILITQTSGMHTDTNIALIGNLVVWSKDDYNQTDIAHDGNLYVYNTSTQTLQKITSYRLDDYDPTISGTYVIWSRAQLAQPYYGSDLKYYRLLDLGLQP